MRTAALVTVLAAAGSLWAAAAQRVPPGPGPARPLQRPLTLMDDVVEVPAASWRSFDLDLRQSPALIRCRFAVETGGSGVRLALLRREDLGRLRAGLGHHVLAATGFLETGSLNFAVPRGEYSLVLDNRLEGRGVARVTIEVSVAFPLGPPLPRVLSPTRRAVIVVLSLLFFIAVVIYVGRKLRRAVANRRSAPPPFWG